MTASHWVLLSWSPLEFDPGTLFWTWVVFGMVCLILGKFVWKPLIQALEDRERKIQGGLEEAENAREEARKLRVGFEAQVKEARAESRRMADEARVNAGRLAETIEAGARANAEQLVQNARQEITLAKRQAQEELRQTAVDLAIEAASAVLQRNVGGEDNRRIASEVIGSIKGG